MEDVDQGRHTIMVVDDEALNLKLIVNLLKPAYRVLATGSGAKALEIALADSPPDLILLDVMMPGLSGFEVCKALRADPRTAQIPIIFLTGRNDVEDESLGFELGASDYIAKPLHPTILKARVKTHLAAKSHAEYLQDKAAYLENEVAKRTEELTLIQDVTIQAMASLAETRDADTGNHIRRTQHYVKALACEMRKNPKYAQLLTDRLINNLFKCSALHDIGKVGIPDRILLKPGRFTPDEFEIMKTHTTLGRNALEVAERTLGKKVDFLDVAKDIAYSHQEKWDGSGYPEGLKGDAIPFSARLMAIADVYDALISKRIYKDGMPHAQAMAIIRDGNGSHFDPEICNAFLSIDAEINAIAEQFSDSDHDIRLKAAHLASFQ